MSRRYGKKEVTMNHAKANSITRGDKHVIGDRIYAGLHPEYMQIPNTDMYIKLKKGVPFVRVDNLRGIK